MQPRCTKRNRPPRDPYASRLLSLRRRPRQHRRSINGTNLFSQRSRVHLQRLRRHPTGKQRSFPSGHQNRSVRHLKNPSMYNPRLSLIYCPSQLQNIYWNDQLLKLSNLKHIVLKRTFKILKIQIVPPPSKS